MRVFAISDLHLDYDINYQWVAGLSERDYADDVLILAGDVSDSLPLLARVLRALSRRFKQLLYVPGNHELWVHRDEDGLTSFEKFDRVVAVAAECGASMQPFSAGELSIVPLLGWYDYSFAQPDPSLGERWMDYRNCRWPGPLTPRDVTERFVRLNEPWLETRNDRVISFSHFLPRIDVMPDRVPAEVRALYAVLGTVSLDAQIKRLRSALHVYGHSHLNRRTTLDNIVYVNNAFGYPAEERIAAKRLLCIYQR